ncbi:MAG: ABC transporter permease [Candidatus Bipolaricaulia bacterium]
MNLRLLIPLRNLWRNRRRTLLGVAIIALGTMMSFAVLGYVDFSLQNIRQSTIDEEGNIQIASPLYWNDETEDYEHLIQPDALQTLTEILDKHERVTAYTPQLSVSGLAYIGDGTRVLNMSATRPGNSALDVNDLVTRGEGLEAGDGGSVLIGETLAENLGLTPGDAFQVNATTVSGQYNLSPLRVKGIFSLNSEQAETQVAYVPLSFAQQLLDTGGVDKLIVTTPTIRATDPVMADLQSAIDEAGLDLKARPWYEVSDFYGQISTFFNALFGFITLAMFVLVFFMILQVLTLSFLERTREVGTIRAIGTHRSQVLSMFLMESVFLGILGSIAGIGLGFVVGGGFNSLGIGWTPPGAVEAVPVRLELTLANAWLPALLTTVATIISSFYPSIHSARVQIVEALRIG